MYLDKTDRSQWQTWEAELSQQYSDLQRQHLDLDITRGKPCDEQLALSDALDGLLKGNYKTDSGVDTRNYGGIDGIKEGKRIGADLLGVASDSILVGGNSSLTLMFQAVMIGMHYGFGGSGSGWLESATKDKATVKFLCSVPGYDRHFSVCETLGIEMVNIPMTSTGPDMDAAEAAVSRDPHIKGIWCVPKYSNPTGIIFDDACVERMAQLGKIAGPNFRVFWDNAYGVHDLTDKPPQLASIAKYCQQFSTEDSVIQFSSTSKITHPGAGVSFLSASPNNLSAIKKVLASITIGPDKINQLRHHLLLPNKAAILDHMQKHAAIVKPHFDTVLQTLSAEFEDSDLGEWQSPKGGYFISYDARPGCAKDVIKMAADAGVKLTPAGATFPYRKDPEDKNIRIAPTVPTIEQLQKAMEVFVTCVKLVSVRQKLANNA